MATADQPQKLTAPQRKALTRYAEAGEQGMPWFGQVDRRLKTMGLIEYVGNHVPYSMHRITEKGRRALGIAEHVADPSPHAAVYDAAAARFPEGSTGHALRTHPVVRRVADQVIAAGSEDAVAQFFDEYADLYYRALGGKDADGPGSVARAIRDLVARATGAKPKQSKRLARAKARVDVLTNHDIPFLRGAKHQTRKQLENWKPIPGASDEQDQANRAEVQRQLSEFDERLAGSEAALIQARQELADAEQAETVIPGPEAAADVRTGTPATEDTGSDHERVWITSSAPDHLRRRAAVLAWMANHPELPGPRAEEYGPYSATLRYAYPGPGTLLALHQALTLDDDAVSLDTETGGYVRVDAWIGPWRVLVLIDFDEHTDEFSSHLSASENPSRFLEIAAALNTRTHDRR